MSFGPDGKLYCRAYSFPSAQPAVCSKYNLMRAVVVSDAISKGYNTAHSKWASRQASPCLLNIF